MSIRFARAALQLTSRLVVSAVLAIVAVSMFLTYDLPSLRAYGHTEATVNVDGPCRDENEGAATLKTCAGTWIDGSATIHGEVTGKDLAPGRAVTARVAGDRARVPFSGGILALTTAAALAVAVASLVALRGRRRSRSNIAGG